MSGDDADVGEHRSEKYRRRIELAGKTINLARERKEWSQAELARRAGLNKSDISRLENGKHLEISVGRFFDICIALGLDAVEVWTGTPRDGKQSRDGHAAPSSPSVESEVRPSSRRKH